MARIVPIMQHSFSVWDFSPPCSYSHTGSQNVCSGSTVFCLGVIGKIDGDGIFSEVINTEDYFTDDESIAQ